MMLIIDVIKIFFFLVERIDRILQCSYFNTSLLCTKIKTLRRTVATGNLEAAISVFDLILNRSILRPQCKTSCPSNEGKRAGNWIYLQQCGLQSGLLSSLPFSSLTLKLDSISVVFDSALIKQSTKTCFYTVTPLWRTLDSTLTILKIYTQRDGKVFPLRVGLEGDTRNQRGFVGYWSTVATTTFFDSYWLSPLYFWSQVGVLASHLALEQVLCKHTFGGCDFHTPYFTHPSVLLFIRTV